MLSDRLKHEMRNGTGDNSEHPSSPFLLNPRDYDDNSRNVSTCGTTNKTHLNMYRADAQSRQSQTR